MPRVPPALVRANSFSFQTNNFRTVLSVSSEAGLVGLLTVSADLYHAELLPDVFEKNFKEVKHDTLHLLNQLVRNPQGIESEIVWYLDSKLKFLHIGLSEPWKLPCFITQYQKTLTWYTGSNRLLATGMCKNELEKSLRVLCTDFDRTTKLFDHFKNIVKITNDRDLATLLNVEFMDYTQHNNYTESANCAVYLEWGENPGPCLRYFDPDNRDFFDQRKHQYTTYVDGVINRLRRLKPNRILKFWADDPNKVYDSTGTFKLVHMGSGTKYEISSNITNDLYHDCMFGPKDVEESILKLNTDRYLDVGELLLWVNTTDNVYLDKDLTFGFILDRQSYTTKTVSASNYPK